MDEYVEGLSWSTIPPVIHYAAAFLRFSLQPACRCSDPPVPVDRPAIPDQPGLEINTSLCDPQHLTEYSAGLGNELIAKNITQMR